MTNVWSRKFGIMLFLHALASLASAQSLQSTLWMENFDSLVLGDSVNERQGVTLVTRRADDPDSTAIPNVFSPVGPAGWTVNNSLGQFDGVPSPSYNPMPTTGNSGVPGQGIVDYGVDEWEGWSFANKDFWIQAAGGQDRDQFTNGVGTIAVVDPDEYFDLGPDDGSSDGPSNPTNGGYYNSGLSTPAINVTENTLYSFSFDSSWRDEAFDDEHPLLMADVNNQAVEILARFSDGTTQVVEGWNSDPMSATFKNDTQNERVEASVFVPAGSSSVTFEFNMANAGNDWWWAVDNINLSELGGNSVFSEDFEGVSLGDSVNERTAFAKRTVAEGEPDTVVRPNSFTHETPAGWSVDNSGLPGGGRTRDDNGVFEFEGWSFMDLEFWTFADLQGREEFTKCVGNCAVADSDEFDDLGAGNDTGPLDTLLKTPQVDISSIAEGQLGLLFDSAWRAEDEQTALVTAEFFDAAGNSLGTSEPIRWESDSTSMFFKPDARNETVLVGIDNPADAASVELTFSYLNGSNNYYWAIDNVQLGVVPEPSSLGLLLTSVLLGLVGLRKRR